MKESNDMWLQYATRVRVVTDTDVVPRQQRMNMCKSTNAEVAWLDLWGAWKGGAALGTSIYDVSIPKFFDLMVMAGIPRTKLVKDTQHTHARTIYSHARRLFSLFSIVALLSHAQLIINQFAFGNNIFAISQLPNRFSQDGICASSR